jgi:hypothetical protein
MSQNNNDKKVERPEPKVDRESLAKSIKDKDRIVKNNQTVKK